jgi:hypothetical protein
MAKLEISVGFKIDKAFEAQLDEARAISGEDRATFMREAVRVAMLRAIGGTGASEAEGAAAPRFDIEDATRTIWWLKEALVDFKQIADDMRRQAAELQAVKRDDAAAIHRARTEFLDGYPERIMKTQKPVLDQLIELSAKMDSLPGIDDIQTTLTRIEAAVVDALAGMAEAADRNGEMVVAEARATRALVKETARRRPALFNLVIAERSWSTTFLATWTLGTSVLGALGLVQIASLFSPMATSMVSHLIDGDRGVCELIERRYGRQDCLVPRDRRIQLAPPARSAAGKRR